MDRDFVRRMALTRTFRAGAPSAVPAPDGKTVLYLASGPRDVRQSLFELDVASGKTRELLSPDAIARGAEALSAEERARRERMRIFARGFTQLEPTRDGSRVLVSLSGRLFVLTRATGAYVELRTGAGAAIDPRLSPDGSRVAYVRGGDLYAVATDGHGAEVAITRGATETKTHGLSEFVAQEELGRTRGFWWSPDGAKILYEEADTSKVDLVAVADPAYPEKEPDRTRYPRPGRPNAEVRLGIVGAHGEGATTWVEWDRARFPYVATVHWSTQGTLAVYLLDRLQEHGELVAIDPASGHTRLLVAEHDEAWLNVDASVPRFLADGSFLWSSERSGRDQLELRDARGASKRALTEARDGYRALLDVDEARGVAVFQGDDDATTQAVYEVPLAGGKPRAVAKVERGRIEALFRHSHDLFVTAEASATSLTTYHARRASDGARVAQIPSAVEDPGFVPQIELATVGPDRVNVVLVRPRGGDPRARRPVIDAAYGGPGHNTVVADAGHYLREQWLADATGAVVVSLDARGTPDRDRAWERAIDGKLADVPLDGHVATLHEIGRAYPELDMDRVGIFGWSYGGYLSALAVLSRPDVFKVGVAGASVTDWRLYDTCYTERYLGLPSEKEGAGDAYDRASLLPRARLAPGAEARPLLLLHGTADDNVYFAHTLRLADALQREQRAYELMPLMGVTHMPVDPALAEAMWTRIAEFLRQHLR